MTSDETLVATVIKDLLEHNLGIDTLAQVALEMDTEELKLPAIVVSATFESEERRSELPKQYAVTTELRSINRVHDDTAIDEIFAQIGETLCPALSGAFTYVPSSMSTNFGYFTIEKQDGSTNEVPGDTTNMTRSYLVFAKLR